MHLALLWGERIARVAVLTKAALGVRGRRAGVVWADFAVAEDDISLEWLRLVTRPREARWARSPRSRWRSSAERGARSVGR